MNADAPTRSAVFLGVVGSSRTNATARSAARPSFLARLANPDDDRNDRRDRSGRSGSGCANSPRCVPFCRFPLPTTRPTTVPTARPALFFFDSRRSGSGVSVPRSTKASRDTPAATAGDRALMRDDARERVGRSSSRARATIRLPPSPTTRESRATRRDTPSVPTRRRARRERRRATTRGG